MKRITWLLVWCLVAALLFGGCSSTVSLSKGDYMMEGTFEEGVTTPFFRLNPELGEFLLDPGPYGIFTDYGTYIVDGDSLTATSLGNVYAFRIVDGNTLVYEGAHTTNHIDLPADATFIYTPEDDNSYDDLLHGACVL